MIGTAGLYFYEPSWSNVIKLPLRRTACTERQRSVHRSVLYSVIASHPIAIGFTQTLSLSKWKGRTLVHSIILLSKFVDDSAINNHIGRTEMIFFQVPPELRDCVFIVYLISLENLLPA